jgi:hypothetical protein
VDLDPVPVGVGEDDRSHAGVATGAQGAHDGRASRRRACDDDAEIVHGERDLLDTAQEGLVVLRQATGRCEGTLPGEELETEAGAFQDEP